MSLFLFFFISILLCFLNGATTTEFDFSTLAISNLKLLGDARLSNGFVSLTRDLSVPNSGAGKALYFNPTDSDNLDLTFRQASPLFSPSAAVSFGLTVSNGSGSKFVAVEFESEEDLLWRFLAFGCRIVENRSDFESPKEHHCATRSFQCLMRIDML